VLQCGTPDVVAAVVAACAEVDIHTEVGTTADGPVVRINPSCVGPLGSVT
jgi:hypothetical protein